MASTIPNQERVVDPFASYNSNVVNRITEIVTQNTEGMLTVNSMQVELDTTSPNNTVIVQPGYAVKDDVLIKITSSHTVDITDLSQYVSETVFFPGAGNYYLVLEYQYLKQRPAPQANIKIIKPTERGLITSGSVYLLLKVLTVDAMGNILSIHDYDPETGYEDNTRPYIKYYAGGEVNLPTYNQVRDQGRIAYESQRDKFFFGYENAWGELAAGGVAFDVNTDTTGVSVGELCYVDNVGNAQPAISTGLYTQADMVVTAIGTAASGIGRGIICGYWSGVPVETGILIGVGDLLYLSATDAGTVTNIRPDSYYQVVGRSLSSASSTTPVDMIFSPKIMLALSLTGQLDTWSGPDGTGYYADINVAALDGTSAFDCHWFDDTTNREIRPTEVEILGGGNIIRVYFPVNTLTVNYIIQSVGVGSSTSGGGGSGTSDHALLLSLDYASSGHTGFAPDPHGNGSHSGVYIEASGVTYGNLLANGDIGSGGTQVPVGNHTHEVGDPHNYNDVPSGSIILFEADTAIVGYSLLADQDDMLVYITKGSAAGGEAGGTLKSGGTWTQPNHSHVINTEASHTHTTNSHTLTTSEIPSHYHTLFGDTGYTSTGSALSSSNYAKEATDFGDGRSYNLRGSSTGPTVGRSSSVGSGSSHNHGSTGSDGDHDHGGNTDGGATANSWRPRGRNMTRQQKI